MRRLYATSSWPMSRPRASSAAGASIHAVAGMVRSRCGVAGRSTVCTGVGSIGRSSGSGHGPIMTPATLVYVPSA